MGRGFRAALGRDRAWEDDVVVPDLACDAARIRAALASTCGAGPARARVPRPAGRGPIDKDGEGDDGDLA